MIEVSEIFLSCWQLTVIIFWVIPTRAKQMIISLHITLSHMKAVRAFKNMFYSKSVTVQRYRNKSSEIFLKSHHSYTVELIQSAVTHTPGFRCGARAGALCSLPWPAGNPLDPVASRHILAVAVPPSHPTTSPCVPIPIATAFHLLLYWLLCREASCTAALLEPQKRSGGRRGWSGSLLTGTPNLLSREIMPGYKLCTYPGVSSQPKVHNTNWVNRECEFQGMTWEIHSSHIIWGKSAEDRLAGFHPLSAHGEKHSNTVGCDHQEWEHRNADL